jgi:hypothetical protein
MSKRKVMNSKPIVKQKEKDRRQKGEQNRIKTRLNPKY